MLQSVIAAVHIYSLKQINNDNHDHDHSHDDDHNHGNDDGKAAHTLFQHNNRLLLTPALLQWQQKINMLFS